MRNSEASSQSFLHSFFSNKRRNIGTVNLRHGIPPNETPVVCTSCAGTYLLEFGVLSILTGRYDFYEKAKIAALRLYHARSGNNLHLLGAHINGHKNKMTWTQMDSTIGTHIDSYFEYLLKGYVLFGDVELLQMFLDLASV